jgi:hypothetical protein
LELPLLRRQFPAMNIFIELFGDRAAGQQTILSGIKSLRGSSGIRQAGIRRITVALER